jgi:hypothetical protein
MGRQRSLAWEQVSSTLPDRSKGWRWSPKRRENGIGWRTNRPSQLHSPHTWRLVRLHPVLSDKLLGGSRQGHHFIQVGAHQLFDGRGILLEMRQRRFDRGRQVAELRKVAVMRVVPFDVAP